MCGMQPFSILIKPAGGACNLDCKYCFYKRHPGGLMTDKTRDRLLKEYIELPFYLKSIALQGGEPLLAWDTFIFNLLSETRLFTNMAFEKSVQTNATLVTDEIAEKLAYGNWLVGASLDGPREFNRFRGDSFDATCRGIRKLEAAGVDYNLLTVVSKANVAHPVETYRFLRDNFSTRFHQYIECTGPCCEINADEWGYFLCGLFDEWIKADAHTISVRLFDSIVSKLVLGRTTQCSFARSCRQYLVVEYDGSVYPCDFHVTDELCLGNINEKTLVEMIESAEYKRFADAKMASLPDTCRSCKYLDICNGDCPRNRQRLCAGWRRFFDHALPRLKELAAEI